MTEESRDISAPGRLSAEERRDRRQKLRDDLIEAFVSAEAAPLTRDEWFSLTSLAKHYPNNHKALRRRLYRWFTPHELGQIEVEAVQRRIARLAPHITQLLEALWQRGMDGDTTAAKEFLNRVMGAPKQQILMTHEASDDLQNLLAQIAPREAYQQPRITDDGGEIIDVEEDDADGSDQD